MKTIGAYCKNSIVRGMPWLLAAVVIPAAGFAREDGKAASGSGLVASVDAAAPGQAVRSFGEQRTADAATIRDFALFNYSRLSNDIVNGRGQYLDALFTLLDVEEGRKSAVRQDLRALLVRHRRVPEFAADIAEYGRRK